MRNRLNAAVLAVEMLRLQIAAGNTSAAQEPLDKVVDELRVAAILQPDTTPPQACRPKRDAPGRPYWSRITPTRVISSRAICG